VLPTGAGAGVRITDGDFVRAILDEIETPSAVRELISFCA
jgi:hypothetical protein